MHRTASARFLIPGILLIALAGCHNGSTHHAAAPSTPAAQTAQGSAIDLYNTRHYAAALAQAEQDMLSTKGRDHEVAQLTAGLSAYALDQTGIAQTYLLALTGASDPRIAGRAEAVLGQIAEARGNHQYAVDLFKRASAHLEGDDSARASVRAGNSLNTINRPVEAASEYRAAAKEADSLAIKKKAARLGEPGPFTIQLGAYTSRAGAEKKVLAMRPTTIKAGIGTPRLVPDTVAGRPGFAVQVGIFVNRSEAATAKSKLGTGTYLVVGVD